MIGVTNTSMQKTDAFIEIQTKDTRSVLKALYLYNFATLTDWPSNYKSGDFIIAVAGNSKVFEELQKKYSGKGIGSQKISVKKIDISEISSNTIHLLFVSNELSSKVKYCSDKLSSKSTLIVSESSGALRSGAIINFIVDNNKQAYEISKKNAGRHKLVFASKLVNLATRIE